MREQLRSALAYGAWLVVVGGTRLIHTALPETVRFWSSTVQVAGLTVAAVYLIRKTHRMDRQLIEAQTRLDIITEVSIGGLLGQTVEFLDARVDYGALGSDTLEG